MVHLERPRSQWRPSWRAHEQFANRCLKTKQSMNEMDEKCQPDLSPDPVSQCRCACMLALSPVAPPVTITTFPLRLALAVFALPDAYFLLSTSRTVQAMMAVGHSRSSPT